MNTNDLERMLALVSAELLEWKRLMPRWADVVRAHVTPSITGAMWMPVVGVCARSKGCTNCPHSLSWRKLVQIRIPDAMREAGLKKGEVVPKFFYRWSNKRLELLVTAHDLMHSMAYQSSCRVFS